VNWDTKLLTAISDLEVQQIEVKGSSWHLRYPIEGKSFNPDDASTFIVVATTRPETMLGDTAVAVHPSDERYTALIGKAVRLPIVNRPIPIIADEYPDPEKGSGAVKITPAHDFNDFMVGKRHNLPMINILDDFAKLNDNVPAEYRGLDRFVARKKVVEEFERLGLLREVEKTRHTVPHGDRSGVVVEPYLTDQWYVNAEVLARPAIKAVEQGDTVFVPKAWEKTYFEWMRNIQPWCISRQLWWGHRIPAWYGPDGKVFVAESEDEARRQARELYGHDEPLRQDEDVLDTWFSSALWPFSTLGWPEKTADLARFYPTHTLVTGFDIIFFWVARMMMQGEHFMGGVPFKRIFINALVRDAEGKKMSKAKGNVVDPLELVDDYGADALRFTLTAMTSGGRDLAISRQRIEGYRNFGTKLWNATRFTQVNGAARGEGFDPAKATLPLNRWIVGETTRTARAVTAALDTCGFDAAADGLYRFVWRQYCDWYVELSKPVLGKPDEPCADEAARDETRATAAWVLDVILKLLHPVMPFLTEELWAQTAGQGAPREHTGFLMTAPWPDLPDSLIDPAADATIGLIVETIAEGRSVRAELNVPNGARPPLLVVEATEAQRRALGEAEPLIRQMLRVEGVQIVDAAPAGAIPYVVEGATLALPVAEFIDVAAERARLGKEVAALGADIDRTAKKLANADFVARAPEEVVEENRERLAEAEAAKAKLEAALGRLQTVA
jgi:valyl-tRNA synthetase